MTAQQIDLVSNGVRIGYARVSTLEQNLDLQIDALTKAACADIYTEKKGGAQSKDRPELANALRALRPGDTFIVWRLDRLGRTVRQLINIVTDLKDRGIHFQSIEDNIDTTTKEGEMLFTLMAAFAQYEHSTIKERTAAGLVAARQRGRVGGRKAKLDANQVREIKALHESQKFTMSDLAAKYGVSRPTLYKALREFDQQLLASRGKNKDQLALKTM